MAESLPDQSEQEARIREAMREMGYRVSTFAWEDDHLGVVLNPLDGRGPGTYVTAELPKRECGEPSDDGSGKVCRRLCAPGRDYHGGGHWYADPDLDGDFVRHSTARAMVTNNCVRGEQK